MKDDQKNHTRDEGGKEKRKTKSQRKTHQKKIIKSRRETIEDSLRI
jgi:hypothetical protein